jgi:DNA repair protein RecN (Recombination protein N)
MGRSSKTCYLLRSTAGIEASPEKLQQLEERLALLERLKRKFQAGVDVVARREALRRELADLERGEDRIAELADVAATARPLARPAPSAERRRWLRRSGSSKPARGR